MKKKFLWAPSLFFGIAILITACSKENIPINNQSNTKTINALFQGLRSTPQTFTVTAGVQQTITGANGTKITFNPQSFKDASGNVITSGSITIKLVEMYKPGQMIANRVTTTTAAQKALTSGGAVNIQATLNQHEVFANSYSIAFKQEGDSNNPMALFRGYQVTDSTGVNVKWYDDTTGTVPRTVKDSGSQNLYYYAFDSCTSFDWINCDYFYTAPAPKTDITIVAPDSSYNMTNTQVFVIFPGINSVTTTYSYDAATHSFSFGYPSYYLPVGTSIDIMILGGKNDNYFMELKSNLTVTNGMSVNFVPVTKTLSEIKDILIGL